MCTTAAVRVSLGSIGKGWDWGRNDLENRCSMRRMLSRDTFVHSFLGEKVDRGEYSKAATRCSTRKLTKPCASRADIGISPPNGEYLED